MASLAAASAHRVILTEQQLHRCSSTLQKHIPQAAAGLGLGLSIRRPHNLLRLSASAISSDSAPALPTSTLYKPSAFLSNLLPVFTHKRSDKSSAKLRGTQASAGDGSAPANGEAETAWAIRRVERVGRYFRRLGFAGFWIQLACSIVAAVILAFSAIMKGTPASDVTTYLTFAGIVAAFISVFWHFGYMRLSDTLRMTAENPNKAPSRSSVVKNLKDGITINLFGLAFTLVGLQATVGLLVAKALTSTAPMYGAVGAPAGYNPVLALDVFLVQASSNTALSHFVGLVLSLELLRSVTSTPPPPASVFPKPRTTTA